MTDLISFLPNMGNVAYTLVAFVIALSIIVAIHEYGHYIVARWCGIYSEVFSLGFGPVIYSREDSYGTKWQIAALPLGGYVKFLGDASAVSDKASDDLQSMDAETLRHTMHGAPLWARAATVAAGPVFNFILSFILFTAMFLFWGQPIEPPTVSSVAPLNYDVSRLRQGDVITGIEDAPVADFATLAEAAASAPRQAPLTYQIRRDDQAMEVQGPFPFPPRVIGLEPKSAAIQAGMKVGDVVTHIDGAPIVAFSQLQEAVLASEGAPISLTIWRAGDSFDVLLTPKIQDRPKEGGGFERKYLIGMVGGLVFEWESRVPGPLEAVSMGAGRVSSTITNSLSGLYHLVTGQIGACNLGGPITIARSSGAAASQGFSSFVGFVALLSTAVGLLNLFPIPVLDGGHLVFHAYEAVFRRPPSDKALRLLMSLGLTAILALMVFALSNDIMCP